MPSVSSLLVVWVRWVAFRRTGAMDGTFDIGMASRELKDEEAAQLTGTVIALDGIAVVVNPANAIDDLSMDQIKSIYVGDITDWSDLA